MPNLNIQLGFAKSEDQEEISKNKFVLIVKEVTTTIVLGYAAITIFRIVESALTKRLS